MMRPSMLLAALTVAPSPGAAQEAGAVGGAEAGAAVEATPDSAEQGGELEIIEIDGMRYQVDANGDLVPIVEEAEAVVVTGSRIKETAEKGTVKVDTITHEEIAERGHRNLADVLTGEVGVQVTSERGTGKSVIMDGLDGKYVLVLIDGRPVYGRVNSRLDMSRVNINPDNVERIEIVRGPMSALYGSEALGGVINIITRQPREELTASLSVDQMLLPQELDLPGSAIQTTGSGFVSGRYGPVAAKLDLAGTWARAYDRNLDGKTDGPGRTQADVGGEVNGFVSERTKVIGYLKTHHIVVDAKVAGDAPFNDRLRDNYLVLGVGLDQTVGKDHALKIDLRGDQFRHLVQRVTELGGQEVENLRTDVSQTQLRSEITYEAPLLRGIDFVDRLDMVLGTTGSVEEVSRLDDQGESTLWGEPGRLLAALYGEVLYRPWDFLTVVPGLRGDMATGSIESPEGFDEEHRPYYLVDKTDYNLGPKLSLRADIPWGGLAVRASYGEGFRTPTFIERYLIFDHSEQGFMIYGYPYLEPEKSRGIRLAALASPTRRFGLEAEYFLNLFENMIDYVYIGDTEEGLEQYQTYNFYRSYTSGLNLSANARDLGGSVDLTLTYQYLIAAVDSSLCPDSNPYFCDDVTSLPLRPAHAAHFKAAWHSERIGTRLYSHINVMSGRPHYDPDSESIEELPSYALIGIGARQRITDKTELNLLVDNLLDAYHPIYGPKPGRSLWLGMHVRY